MKKAETLTGKAAIEAAGLSEFVRDECHRRRVTLSEILATGRGSPRVSRARHAIWAAIRAIRSDGSNDYEYSLAEIGRMFFRDHTTVLYAIRAFYAAHPEFAEALPKKFPKSDG